jgi:hypothetical protein
MAGLPTWASGGAIFWIVTCGAWGPSNCLPAAFPVPSPARDDSLRPELACPASGLGMAGLTPPGLADRGTRLIDDEAIGFSKAGT